MGPRQFLWISSLQLYSSGGILYVLTVVSFCFVLIISTHHWQLWLLGYLIPFAPTAFVSKCQDMLSKLLLPLVFLPIFMHFTAPLEIPPTCSIFQAFKFQLPFNYRIDFDNRPKKPPTDALRPIKLNNACIPCLTAAAGTELANAFLLLTVIASFSVSKVYKPNSCLPSYSITSSGFCPLWKIPHCCLLCKSLGLVSVPVWLFILSRSAIDHCLVGLLPRQPANQMQAFPGVDFFFSLLSFLCLCWALKVDICYLPMPRAIYLLLCTRMPPILMRLMYLYDLHVLGMLLAFILGQDQTLLTGNPFFFIRLSLFHIFIDAQYIF